MPLNPNDVFVNCPFDDTYRPLFNAIVYVVVRSGYRVRCALETDNGVQNRLAKIQDIIAECRFGIHDISRTEASPGSGLPRFNMPLELGLFLGAQRFGDRHQRSKSCLIFDRERFRYQQFISDIAGADIRAHADRVPDLIRELSAWLRLQPGGMHAGGGRALAVEYDAFTATALPVVCADLRMQVGEIEFVDYNDIVTDYVARLTIPPAPPA